MGNKMSRQNRHQDNWRKSLWAAAKRGDVRDIIARAKQLNKAMARKNGKTSKLLKDHGVSFDDKDDEGLTALMHASRNNHHRVVSALLKAKANPNHENYKPMTALMWAIQTKSADAVTALITGGASVNYVTTRRERLQQWTPLYYAIYCIGNQQDKSEKHKTEKHKSEKHKSEHTSMVKLLIQHGADAESAKGGRPSPMQFVVARGGRCRKELRALLREARAIRAAHLGQPVPKSRAAQPATPVKSKRPTARVNGGKSQSGKQRKHCGL